MVSLNRNFARKSTTSATTTTHKRCTAVNKFVALVKSNNNKKTSKLCYRSSNNTRVYCSRPTDTQARPQALLVLCTHIVYSCIPTANTACCVYNCIVFTTKSTSIKSISACPQSPVFYVPFLPEHIKY